MKNTLIVITLFISCPLYGQDTIPAELNRKVANNDTITVTTYSQEALKELTTQITEIQKASQLLGISKIDILNEEIQRHYADLSDKIMLIVSSYIDPKQLVGFTEDQKIIKRK